MATKLDKAQASVNQWQSKIAELQNQDKVLDAELETTRGAIGAAMLDGGDAGKLADDLARTESRKAVMRAAIASARERHTQAVNELAQAKRAERERATLNYRANLKRNSKTLKHVCKPYGQ